MVGTLVSWIQSVTDKSFAFDRNDTFSFATSPLTSKLFVWVHDHKTLGKDKGIAEGEVEACFFLLHILFPYRSTYFRFGIISSQRILHRLRYPFRFVQWALCAYASSSMQQLIRTPAVSLFTQEITIRELYLLFLRHASVPEDVGQVILRMND